MVHFRAPPVNACRVATNGTGPVPSLVMQRDDRQVDIVMAGTFAAWRLGTLQARALPFARELRSHGIRCSIVTVPWDTPIESGVRDAISGVEVFNTSSSSVQSFPLAVTEQCRRILALRPKAVHVFKPKGFGGLAGQILSRRLPIVVDSDDWEGDGGWNDVGDYSILQRRLFDWQERSMLRKASAVTAASHLLTRRAITLRDGSKHHVTWIPNGLDDDWANRLSQPRRASVQSANHRTTIVLYSRFAEFGPEWLPRFLTSLSSRMTESELVKVVIVGDMPELSFENERVKLDQMGYVAHETLPVVLGQADIAIYPYFDSLITRSKNSVKILELLTSGCATIASRIGDVPAIAPNGMVMLDSTDPDAFAAEAMHLLRNPDRRRAISVRGQRDVTSTFTIGAITQRLIGSYRIAGIVDSGDSSL